jgi:hypothetical protein
VQVRVPRDGIGKMMAAFPQLMGLSVDATLRPHLQFLRDLAIPPWVISVSKTKSYFVWNTAGNFWNIFFA